LSTTARHPWALAAAAGDPAYRAFYRVFADRELPDRFERTLPEVFPDQAPGSFTHVDGVGWVWTTFNDYQWDLDWSNPDVFEAMLTVVLVLANRGIEVLRLDAAPFLWKREGTDSQNQPEVLLVLQALRACVAVAAPGVRFKAEAIVAPQQLVAYLGAHDRFRPECDLAYHNQLMVMLWSTLATRDVTLARQSLTSLRPAPSSTAWVTYLLPRRHRLGGVRRGRARRRPRPVGPSPVPQRLLLRRPPRLLRQRRPLPAHQPAHRRQPHLGDGGRPLRARNGPFGRRRAGERHRLRRLLTLYSVVYSFGGIPLLYMGDEFALPNDERWAQVTGQAEDNRWMHRPRMVWAAQRRHDPASVEGRAFAGIAGMAAARARLAVLQSGTGPEVLDTGDRRVLAFARRHPGASPFIALANFSDDPVRLPRETALPGLSSGARIVASSESTELTAYDVALPSWGHAWVADL